VRVTRIVITYGSETKSGRCFDYLQTEADPDRSILTGFCASESWNWRVINGALLLMLFSVLFRLA